MAGAAAQVYRDLDHLAEVLRGAGVDVDGRVGHNSVGVAFTNARAALVGLHDALMRDWDESVADMI